MSRRALFHQVKSTGADPDVAGAAVLDGIVDGDSTPVALRGWLRCEFVSALSSEVYKTGKLEMCYQAITITGAKLELFPVGGQGLPITFGGNSITVTKLSGLQRLLALFYGVRCTFGHGDRDRTLSGALKAFPTNKEEIATALSSAERGVSEGIRVYAVARALHAQHLDIQRDVTSISVDFVKDMAQALMNIAFVIARAVDSGIAAREGVTVWPGLDFAVDTRMP